jgi:hypothetical protein
LYDLTTDPEELKNLAGDTKHVDKLASLRRALVDELKRTGAPAEMMPGR